MLPKKEHPKEKPGLHPRNRHKERYDFKILIGSCPELTPFVRLNEYQDESIDFFDPKAVMMLNKALLKHYYGIERWEVPQGYLCPPIPGRADYIHHIAGLLGSGQGGIVPTGSNIRCLDIGVGANCIYPIIGIQEYGWSFVGADIEPAAIASASEIIKANSCLQGSLELRLQTNPKDIFRGVIQPNEYFDLTICNPPFHASFQEAQAGTKRKLTNLKAKSPSKTVLNFGGQNKELWCDGGEEKFVRNMIEQSKLFRNSCCWFSTLISKEQHLKSAYAALKHVGAVQVKTIQMSQGNKQSRILAWTFSSLPQRENWQERRK